MASVALLKGANTGGKVFRPSELPGALPRLRLTSLGAAGTFVVGADLAPDRVREQLGSALPFATEIAVVAGSEVLALLERAPLGAGPWPAGTRRFVTVGTGPLDPSVPLPIEVPTGEEWLVRVVAVDGPFAVGLQRRRGPKMVYATDVVERAFRTPATTRWWETIEAVGRLLRAPRRSGTSTPSPSADRPPPRRRA